MKRIVWETIEEFDGYRFQLSERGDKRITKSGKVQRTFTGSCRGPWANQWWESFKKAATSNPEFVTQWFHRKNAE